MNYTSIKKKWMLKKKSVIGRGWTFGSNGHKLVHR